MKNIPRIFIDSEIKTGNIIPIDKSISHYLTHVMRCDDCLCFYDGIEFNAKLTSDKKHLEIFNKTQHIDPSNDITLLFSPIKKTDELLNMATQMGIKTFQPVIMDRTVAHHINWERMKRIVIEAAEQSNRNSIPNILTPVKFADLDLNNLCFADERCAYGRDCTKPNKKITKIMVGPEGGFSDSEFEKLDKSGATGISLGKTILRAEVAAIIAINRIML